MAEGLVDSFGGDGFLKMFKDPERYHDWLGHLESAFVQHLTNSRDFIQGEIQAGHDEHLPGLNRLQESINRVMGVMKCLDYAWGIGSFAAANPPVLLQPQDVLNITTYNGKQMLELILQDPRL